jgi:hypothetical protein
VMSIFHGEVPNVDDSTGEEKRADMSDVGGA